MMSAKDFAVLAKHLAKAREYSVWNSVSYDAWKLYVGVVADAAAEINPRFNRELFWQACEADSVAAESKPTT